MRAEVHAEADAAPVQHHRDRRHHARRQDVLHLHRRHRSRFRLSLSGAVGRRFVCCRYVRSPEGGAVGGAGGSRGGRSGDRRHNDHPDGAAGDPPDPQLSSEEQVLSSCSALATAVGIAVDSGEPDPSARLFGISIGVKRSCEDDLEDANREGHPMEDEGTNRSEYEKI